MTDTTHFPKSFSVRADELMVLPEPRIEIGGHQPTRGVTYTWNPPVTEPFQPSDRAPVPTPPQLVKVKEARDGKPRGLYK